MYSLTHNADQRTHELLLRCLTGASGVPDSMWSDRERLLDVLELADENGVLYELVTRFDDDRSLPPAYRQRWQEELAQVDRLQRTIHRLNDASDGGDIEYILIKDCNTVPHAPRDVDIYVRRTDKERMIDALERQGMEVDHAGEIETSVTGTDQLPVDIYTGLVYFDHSFLSDEAMFDAVSDRTVFDVAYPGLDEETEFLLTLVHGVFGHRRLTLLDFLHLDRLWESDLSLNRAFDIASKHGWSRTLTRFVVLFRELRDAVHGDSASPRFPILLARSDVLECISRLERGQLDYRQRLAVSASLAIDGAKFRIENSPLQEPIKQCSPLRKALLAIGYLSRQARGDKYS